VPRFDIFTFSRLLPSTQVVESITSIACEQFTVLCRSSSTISVSVLEVDTSQLPIIAATDKVNAIRRTEAKNGETPFILSDNYLDPLDKILYDCYD